MGSSSAAPPFPSPPHPRWEGGCELSALRAPPLPMAGGARSPSFMLSYCGELCGFGEAVAGDACPPPRWLVAVVLGAVLFSCTV